MPTLKELLSQRAQREHAAWNTVQQQAHLEFRKALEKLDREEQDQERLELLEEIPELAKRAGLRVEEDEDGNVIVHVSAKASYPIEWLSLYELRKIRETLLTQA